MMKMRQTGTSTSSFIAHLRCPSRGPRKGRDSCLLSRTGGTKCEKSRTVTHLLPVRSNSVMRTTLLKFPRCNPKHAQLHTIISQRKSAVHEPTIRDKKDLHLAGGVTERRRWRNRGRERAQLTTLCSEMCTFGSKDIVHSGSRNFSFLPIQRPTSLH